MKNILKLSFIIATIVNCTNTTSYKKEILFGPLRTEVLEQKQDWDYTNEEKKLSWKKYLTKHTSNSFKALYYKLREKTSFKTKNKNFFKSKFEGLVNKVNNEIFPKIPKIELTKLGAQEQKEDIEFDNDFDSNSNSNTKYHISNKTGQIKKEYFPVYEDTNLNFYNDSSDDEIKKKDKKKKIKTKKKKKGTKEVLLESDSSDDDSSDEDTKKKKKCKKDKTKKKKNKKSDRNKHKSKKKNKNLQYTPFGLMNFNNDNNSNCCFLNSAIQALIPVFFRNTELYNKVLKLKAVFEELLKLRKNLNPQARVTLEFAKILEYANSNSNFEYNPYPLRKALGEINPNLNNNKQEDSCLALTAILEAIENTFSNKPNPSSDSIELLSEICRGSLETKVRNNEKQSIIKIINKNIDKKNIICKTFDCIIEEKRKCTKCRKGFNKYLMNRELVVASIEKNQRKCKEKLIRNISSSIKEIHKPQPSKLHNDQCEEIKKIDAHNKLNTQQKLYSDSEHADLQICTKNILQYPKILILKIDRYITEVKHCNKRNHIIKYEEEENFGGHKYKLLSVIEQKGETADSGHYIAHCKSNNKWYTADDTKIQYIINPLNKNGAMVLIYQKIDKK